MADVRVKEENPEVPTVPATGTTNLLGWFTWAFVNRQKLWNIVLLIAALFGGTVVGSYRQELTDVAVENMPHSTEYQELKARVDDLESRCGCINGTCGCEVQDVVKETPVEDAAVSVRVQ